MQDYNTLKYTLVTTIKYCLPRLKRFTVCETLVVLKQEFLVLSAKNLEREIDIG